MQILKKTGSSILFFLLKSLIFLGLIALLWRKLIHEGKGADALLAELGQLTSRISMVALVAVVVLVPANWLLEAAKWRWLARKVQPMGWGKAIAGVLAGLALGFVSVRFFGDFVGRVGQFRRGKSGALFGVVLLDKTLQLGCTLVFGCFGLYYIYIPVYSSLGRLAIPHTGMLIGMLAGVSLLVLLWWQWRKVPRVLASSINRYLSIFRQFHSSDIVIGALLAVLRYAVFSLQFFMLLLAVGIQLPLPIVLAGIAWVFLVKSLVPAFGVLGGIGIREFSAIYYFEYFDADIASVVAASLLLWAINIVVPSLIGVVFIFTIKLRICR